MTLVVWGRLSMRATFDWHNVEIIKVNDPAGDAKTLAHLMTFDSIQFFLVGFTNHAT